jgi:SPP1 family holin
MKITAGTISRTIVLTVALINQLLTVFGVQTLPIQDAQIHEVVSTVFTIVAAIAAWWKNNSFTKEALEADRFMHELKGGG